MITKTVSFVALYSDDSRRRHYHQRQRNKILQFCVQLELYYENRWIPIVRYDTSHRFVHRDLIHKDGRTEKNVLPIQDYNEALNFAESDLNMNWEWYRRKFLEEEVK